MSRTANPRPHWRVALGNIIFNNDTSAGRYFDLLLTLAILISISVVVLDSVENFHRRYVSTFNHLEIYLTIIFTIEYVLRLLTARHASHYARSFFGMVDLLSLLPAYLSLFIPGTEYLLIIRALRLLRIFRILKLASYLREASVLTEAIEASVVKITVFITVVITLVLIIGTLMYVIEGPKYGFTSIPTGVYWAIVTVTTVGYGDISPHTTLGKTLASLAMILGYGIIAVPTGIVTVGLNQVNQARAEQTKRTNQQLLCPRCGLDNHNSGARYCQRCGEKLIEVVP